MVKIGLIRHARTTWNLEKKIQGKTDIPLCPEGIRQAGHWARILIPEAYEVILSSPLIRARQTARIISVIIGADIVFDADLVEQDFGEWEGKRINDIRNLCPGQIELEESRGWNFCPPGGESRINVFKRVSKAMQKAVHTFDPKKILVVTHNSVIKIVVNRLLGRAFTPDEPRLIKDDHLHELDGGKKIRLERLNHIHLIPPDKAC